MWLLTLSGLLFLIELALQAVWCCVVNIKLVGYLQFESREAANQDQNLHSRLLDCTNCNVIITHRIILT